MQNTDSIIYTPSQEMIDSSHVQSLMRRMNARDLPSLWRKSVADIGGFWDAVLKDTGVEWFQPYTQTVDPSRGIEWTRWFINGKINIAHNCIDRHLTRDREALIWEGDAGETRSLSYRELGAEVNRLAHLLVNLGTRPGDSVAIIMPMVPEVVIGLFACFKVGAVGVPIFSGFGAEAIGIRLQEAGVKCVLTTDVGYRRGKCIAVRMVVDAACKLAPTVRHRIVLRRDKSSDLTEGLIDWQSATSQLPDQFKTLQLDSESPSLILFTSGTTGKPKATVHTHAGALATIVKELRYAFNCDSDSRFFWFTDIGWMMGPWEMIGVTHFGGTLFLFEGAPDFPSPSRIWEMIDRHGLTHLGISPTAIRVLMKFGNVSDRFSLKSLRILGSTGEPWDPQSYLWYFSQVGKGRCPIINISGGTEIIGCILSPIPTEPLKPCSLGGPGLGVDADVFDEAGQSVRGGIGHLVVKQPLPSMTKSFLNSDDRYLETYFSKWKGVWYHGDWARVDSDGFWFLHGRSDDTIKIAGKRVGPVEYEAALLGHGSIAEAAAIGIPDPIKGEVCVLFVVAKPGILVDENLRTLLHGAAISTMGKSLAPKAICFVDGLPKTRSGKILRGLIRKIYLGEPLTDTSSIENIETIQMIASSR